MTAATPAPIESLVTDGVLKHLLRELARQLPQSISRDTTCVADAHHDTLFLGPLTGFSPSRRTAALIALAKAIAVATNITTR